MLYFFLQTIFCNIRYNLPKVNEWETTIGSNGMYQTMQNRGDESLYPDFNLLDNGLFIFTKKKLDKLTLSRGVRVDRRKLATEKLYVDGSGKFQTIPEGSVEERFAGFNKTFSNVTGSVGEQCMQLMIISHLKPILQGDSWHLRFQKYLLMGNMPVLSGMR
jgi:iron complex outermembrane receptor protein